MIARVSRNFGLALAGAAVCALGATNLSAQDLNGAGASFPQPIYSKWFSEYAAKAGVNINYQPIGSGGGVKQFTEGTVDFGASDAPLSDAELAKLKSPAFHIPTVLGAVVMTYNLPEVTKPLNMTGPLIADIYLGKVTKWNDPAIVALEQGCEAAEQGHPRRAPIGRQRHDVHLHRLPHRGEPGVGRGPGQGQGRAVAGWVSAARRTRASWVRCRRSPARSATSSSRSRVRRKCRTRRFRTRPATS